MRLSITAEKGSDTASDQNTTAKSGSPFEAIRHTSEDGAEYWTARELAKVLGYTEYGKFRNTIKKAETACETSGQAVSDHFAHVSDMIAVGKGAHRQVEDVRLSRYACYLVVQNADPEKPIVALGQTYFAVQTRRAELADELAGMPEAPRRLAMRDEVVHRNVDLAAVAARQAGLVSGRDFATFQDHGYWGLYGGETARQIATRKGIGPREKILDWMGSEELAANWFRITQTEAKLRREGIDNKADANAAHHQVGKAVRQTIADLGGTMPEELPTPKESIADLPYFPLSQTAQRTRIEARTSRRAEVGDETLDALAGARYLAQLAAKHPQQPRRADGGVTA